MKIAYVVTQYPPNVSAGLGRYVEEITPHLAERLELTVYTVNNGHQPVYERQGTLGVYRPLGRLLGAAIRRRRRTSTRRGDFVLLAAHVVASNWRYVRRLWRTGRTGRPDLVVLHDSTNFLCGLMCHYLLRLPVVLHIHTTEHGTARRRRGLAALLGVLAGVERWLGRIARRVVVATPEMRDHLVSAGWQPAVIDVVGLGGTFERILADPGFDRDRLRAGAAALRARLRIGAADPVLLFVGRLVPHKGIYQLLAAMPRIAAAVPELRLVVVGDGDHAGVQRVVAQTGLAGRVLSSGGFVERPALLAYYQLADACIFPSTFEPFGLVATEAMALGRPTILGDGFPRVFLGDPDRPAVRYLRSADPDDLARTVTAVMTDPALRAALAERGERFARERLSWVRTAEETLAVYRAALASATRPHLGLGPTLACAGRRRRPAPRPGWRR
jgi:glycosyltransferase involved in cell wall biosynthesis